MIFTYEIKNLMLLTMKLKTQSRGEKKNNYSFNHKYEHHINIHTFILRGNRMNNQPCKYIYIYIYEHTLKQI